MRGFQRKLERAEAEYAQFPSQSTRDCLTYLRAIVELPGDRLTADQASTLAWLAEGGRPLREVQGLRKRDLTCIEKKRGSLIERVRVRGIPWVFVSDLGRFLLRDAAKEAR